MITLPTLRQRLEEDRTELERLGTIEDVARRTGLDRCTVKKYVTAAQPGDETR